MKIYSQSFVTLSSLFDGFAQIKNDFHDYDHSHLTWGTCSRSLVNVSEIKKWACGQIGYDYNRFIDFLDSIPDGVMIDLEN